MRSAALSISILHRKIIVICWKTCPTSTYSYQNYVCWHSTYNKRSAKWYGMVIGAKAKIYGKNTLLSHSSEIRGICLMKWPSKMLQNLPNFWNTKTHTICCLFFILCYFIFSPKNFVEFHIRKIWQILKHFTTH